jgi:hypothetical protein
MPGLSSEYNFSSLARLVEDYSFMLLGQPNY